jgi:transcriptional regulator with XRE-family HTH domain
MKATLKDLLAEHIQQAYDGNQAAFARAAGFKPQTVHTWLKGNVTLPHIDARRRLAKHFGMSHVELLVAIGELEEYEANLPTDPRSEAVRRLQPKIDSVSWDEMRYRAVESLLDLIANPQSAAE